MTERPPTVLIFVPGGGQNPGHYAQLMFLMQKKGYATISSMLPSSGTYEGSVGPVDDAEYIRSRLVLPQLDVFEHNVVLICHSYSGIPSSASAADLGPNTRQTAGKKTAVIGQIHVASFLVEGGNGSSLIDIVFGGAMPMGVQTKPGTNILTAPEPLQPIYGHTPKDLQDSAMTAFINMCGSSWSEPAPRASWDEEDYKGRLGYVHTEFDEAIPKPFQELMLKGTGVSWETKEIATGHSPALSAPEALADILDRWIRKFEAM